MASFQRIDALEEEFRHKEGIFYNLPLDDPDRMQRMVELRNLEKSLNNMKSIENERAIRNGQKGLPFPELKKNNYSERNSFICRII